MIPVQVDQILISNVGFVVLLKGVKDERSLPIFIGAVEAQAIALWLNKVHVPRPLTHDLLKNVLDYLECRLVRVEVSDLKDGTFYAKLILDTGGTERAMDSRPSDAINLALRLEAPVYVDEGVMDEAGRVFPDEKDADEEAPDVSDESKQAPKVPTIESLQHQLDKAVREERYEDAARLRDEIQHLRDSCHGN